MSGQRFAVVPVELGAEMFDAVAYSGGRYSYNRGAIFERAYPVAIAASPNAGRVTAEMLERAAAVVWYRRQRGNLPAVWTPSEREAFMDEQRAAFIAAGFQVEGDEE